MKITSNRNIEVYIEENECVATRSCAEGNFAHSEKYSLDKLKQSLESIQKSGSESAKRCPQFFYFCKIVEKTISVTFSIHCFHSFWRINITDLIAIWPSGGLGPVIGKKILLNIINPMQSKNGARPMAVWFINLI